MGLRLKTKESLVGHLIDDRTNRNKPRENWKRSESGWHTSCIWNSQQQVTQCCIVTKLHLRLSHNDSSQVAAELYPKARPISAASKHGRWKSAWKRVLWKSTASLKRIVGLIAWLWLQTWLGTRLPVLWCVGRLEIQQDIVNYATLHG